MNRIPLVSEEEYDALHDRLCACGTPASALSCPLAVGIVGERCCQGCPDCLGIGVREQIEGLTAEVEALRERAIRYENTLLRMANDDFRGPEPWYRSAAKAALFPRSAA